MVVTIANVLTPVAAAELVRGDTILAFVLRELEELRALDRIRVARMKRAKKLTRTERYRIATTPRQLASRKGRGGLRDPDSIVSYLQRRLTKTDFAEWQERIDEAQSVERAVDMVIEAIGAGRRPPSIKTLAREIAHVRYHKLEFNLQIRLGWLGLRDEWIYLAHIRDIDVMRELDAVERILTDVRSKKRRIGHKQRERLRVLLTECHRDFFGEEELEGDEQAGAS